MSRVEYRVSWRRASWSPRSQNKARRLSRWSDVERFVDRLAEYAYEDELFYEVVVRDVGPWREVR